jgi:mannose/fructose/N-acetylgalactosamine-specific phosphotransferase system component IIC
MSDPLSFVLLIALGTAAALDATSVGQIMISRPIVTGTLAGFLLGDPELGLLLGAILEAAHLGGLPVGGARLPEPGPAAVPAVFLAAAMGGAAGLVAGATLGMLGSLVGGASVSLQRRVNGLIMGPANQGQTSFRGLSLRHWACIGLDGLRGALLTATGLGLAILLSTRIGSAWWRLSLPESIALLLLPGALSGGALLRAWAFPRRRAVLFFLGALGGVVLAVTLT